MSDEITAMRKDIDQLKAAVKTLMDESKSSDLDLKLSVLNKSMLALEGKLINSNDGKLDLSEMKKHITKDFITKLYRG